MSLFNELIKIETLVLEVLLLLFTTYGNNQCCQEIKRRMMKIIYEVIAIGILTVVFSGVVKSQDIGCPMVGEAWIDPEIDYTIAINRYISRTIYTAGLLDIRTPKRCYGGPPEYYESLQETCGLAPETCFGGYCVADYESIIQASADLNATLFFRASSLYHKEHRLNPDDQNVRPYLIQLVQDVNEAYDCAGLRRPIVQAACLEGGSSNLNQTIIPRYVIDFFSDPVSCPGCLTTDEINQYSNPSEVYYFNWENMKYQDEEYYDITKPLSQMWFYAVCTQFVSFGYKGIDMGQYYAYGRDDDGYAILERLYGNIRNYAEDNGTFVLLTGEGGAGFSPPTGPTGKMLFDYISFAMRPREYSGTIEGVGDGGCVNSPLSEGAKSFWNENYCSNESLPAVIDECNVGAWDSYNGVAWNNSVQSQGISSAVYFDWGPGEFVEVNTSSLGECSVDPSQLGVVSAEPGSCWGYNDTNYFLDILDNDGINEDLCKGAWWMDSYCRIKRVSRNNFVQAPGVFYTNKPSLYCNIAHNEELTDSGAPASDYLPVSGSRFLLTEHSEVFNKIQEAWSVSDPMITVNHSAIPIGCCTENDDDPRPLGWHKVSIEVANPDCSTTYSIYVRKPSGDLMNYVIGRKMSFLVPEDGEYQILLRADNCVYQPNCVKVIRLRKNWNSRLCVSEFDPLCKDLRKYNKEELEKLVGDPHANLESYYAIEMGGGAINNEDQAGKIVVFPNPSSGETVIESSKRIDALALYSMDGKLIKKLSFTTNENRDFSIIVNLENFAPGLYILRGKADSDNWIHKIVIQ